MSPVEMIDAYASAFEDLNPDKVVPFYELPCMFVSPHGHNVVTTKEEVRAVICALIDFAKNQGYRRSLVSHTPTSMLGTNMARCSGEFTRLNANDEEIMRFGFSYLLRNSRGEWRILVAVAHDLNTTCEPET